MLIDLTLAIVSIATMISLKIEPYHGLYVTKHHRTPVILAPRPVSDLFRPDSETIYVKLPNAEAIDSNWKRNLMEMRRNITNKKERATNRVPSRPVLLRISKVGYKYKIEWKKTASESHDTNNSSEENEVAKNDVLYFTMYVIKESFTTDDAAYVDAQWKFDVFPQQAKDVEEAGNHFALLLYNIQFNIHYQFYFTASNQNGESAQSNSIVISNFVELADGAPRISEVIILVFLLSLWVFLIYTFYRKWGAIKNLAPRDTKHKRPKQEPVAILTEPRQNPPTTVASSASSQTLPQLKSRDSTLSRPGKIARFKRMREARIRRLKTFSFSQSRSRSNCSKD